MNEMQIIDANFLLANFMGWKYTEPKEYVTFDKVYFTPHTQSVGRENYSGEYGDSMVFEFLIDELKFHESYDWIMEVVDKIEAECNLQKEAVYNVNIEQCFVEIIHNHTSDILVKCDADNKLQAIYQACIEFVKWYNE